MSNTSTVQVYLVPPTFFNDHTMRELPEFGHSVEVGVKGRRLMVEMDAPAWFDLMGDAAYYTDPAVARDMRECGMGPGLPASARATIKALREQAPPEYVAAYDEWERACKLSSIAGGPFPKTPSIFTVTA